jgi:hypothetical protein
MDCFVASLLAMTKESLYTATDRAIALFLMDCRVIPDQVGDRPPAMTKLEQRRTRHMRLNSMRLLIPLMLIAPLLAGCLERSQPTMTISGGDDDDAFCRANNVAVGSSEYIACRKDRDVQRNNANARADRRQRDLGEYMLNHPDRP